MEKKSERDRNGRLKVSAGIRVNNVLFIFFCLLSSGISSCNLNKKKKNDDRATGVFTKKQQQQKKKKKTQCTDKTLQISSCLKKKKKKERTLWKREI